MDSIQFSVQGGMLPTSQGGRVDLEMYNHSVDTAKNWLISPQATLVRRPGTVKLKTVTGQHSNAKSVISLYHQLAGTPNIFRSVCLARDLTGGTPVLSGVEQEGATAVPFGNDVAGIPAITRDASVSQISPTQWLSAYVGVGTTKTILYTRNAGAENWSGTAAVQATVTKSYVAGAAGGTLDNMDSFGNIVDIISMAGRTWVLYDTMNLVASCTFDALNFYQFAKNGTTWTPYDGLLYKFTVKDGGYPIWMVPKGQGLVIGTTKGEFYFNYNPQAPNASNFTDIGATGSSRFTRAVLGQGEIYFSGTNDKTVYSMTINQSGNFDIHQTMSTTDYQGYEDYRIVDLEYIPGVIPVVYVLAQQYSYMVNAQPSPTSNAVIFCIHQYPGDPVTLWTIPATDPNNPSIGTLSSVNINSGYAYGEWHLLIMPWYNANGPNAAGGSTDTGYLLRSVGPFDGSFPHRDFMSPTGNWVVSATPIDTMGGSTFTSLMKTLPIENTPATILIRKTIQYLLLRVRNMVGLYFSTNGTDYQLVPNDSWPDMMDAIMHPLTGDIQLATSSQPTTNLRIYIKNETDFASDLLMWRVSFTPGQIK